MMLTSSGELMDSIRCRDLGISSYLVKPVRQTALCEAILATLGRTASKEATPASVAQVPARALRILLAEDNVVNQRVAIGMLEKAGHTVTLAENGLIALDKLERAPFDLILMDMQMPEMGGAEAIAGHPRAREGHGRRHPDRGADGARAQGGPRTLPRHRRKRLRLEAGLARGAVCGDRAGDDART